MYEGVFLYQDLVRDALALRLTYDGHCIVVSVDGL